MALLYLAKGIRTDSPLVKYYYAAVINTFILRRSAHGPRTDVAGVIPRDRAFLWGVGQPVVFAPNNTL